MSPPRKLSRFFLWAAAASTACAGYRPARFAPQPPVNDVHDDAPIEVPAFRSLPEPIYLSEIYLHRPIRQTLDLSPFPEPGDVNALDEVARSSWFAPDVVDVGTMARGPESVDAPRPPFQVLAEDPLALGDGFSIRDARGHRYDIAVDPRDRPEMKTGAVAIAARLIWAVGLKTPPVFIIQVDPKDFAAGTSGRDAAKLLAEGPSAVAGQYRVAAVSWPAGLHLGRTPEAGGRGDDPNDLVPHETRRTLRALRVFASWLALGNLGPAKTIDRYVGAPRDGHVEHFFVGLDDALGTSDVVRVTDPPPSEGGGSPLKRLWTLGLAPNPPPPPTQLAVRALGQFDANVDPARFGPALPYEPADQLQDPDGYWAAKRIAAVGRAHVALAVDAARFTDGRATRAVEQLLNERARKVIAYWFGRVTPVDLTAFEGKRISLRDESVARGLAPRGATDYRVSFLTASGAVAAEPTTLRPADEKLELILPDAALIAARDYLVVEIAAARGGRRLPRSMQVHVTLVGDRVRVVGVRH